MHGHLFDNCAPSLTARSLCLRRSKSRSLSRIVPFVVAALFLVGLSGATKADLLEQKGDLFLTRVAGSYLHSGWSSVILRIDGKLTASQKAQLRSLSACRYRDLSLIKSLAVRVPNRNLPRLAALPFVKHLSCDAVVHKCDEFTVGSSEADVAFRQYQLDGSGIGVAVLDSGVNSSLDLNQKNSKVSRIVASATFVPGRTPSTVDLCGHGTHVAGIIAGNGAGSTGSTYFRTFYGIARAANIINVRVLDTYGQGYVSDMVSAITWCINSKKRYNIRVMNLSLGHPVGESYTTDPLCQAVEQAWKAGIVVVCAAGNEGRLGTVPGQYPDNEGWGTAYGSIQSPANDPYVLTVGAMKNFNGTRSYDRIATYSSRGPSRLNLILKPDIVAPGNTIISLNAVSSYLANTYAATNIVSWNEFCSVYKSADTSKYFRLAGTSMAAPVVSGAVALMVQRDVSLSPDTVKARLMLSADKWSFPDGTGDACTFGAGYLNIPAAINCAAVAGQYALSPKLDQDSDGYVYIDTSSIWGTKAIWGTGLTDLTAVWGSKAIWGTTTLSSSKAIWGSGVLSDSTVWTIDSGGADLSTKAIHGE